MMVMNKKQLLLAFLGLGLSNVSLYSMERPNFDDKLFYINNSFDQLIQAKIQELQNAPELLNLQQEIDFLREVQQNFNDEVASSSLPFDRIILLYVRLSYTTEYAHFMGDNDSISDELIAQVRNIFKSHLQ